MKILGLNNDEGTISLMIKKKINTIIENLKWIYLNNL